MGKRIVRRKITVPAGADVSNGNYDLRFDKGTEEVTLIFTRLSYEDSSNYGIFIGIGTLDDPGANRPDLLLPANSGIKQNEAVSKYVYTFSNPTLFHTSLFWRLFFNPQAQPVTINCIALVNDDVRYV